MKKILIILSIILLLTLIGFGIFYFLGNGKEKLSNFFSDNSFGSFFDTQQNSQNDLVGNQPEDVTVEYPNDTKYVAPTLRQISFEPISGYTFYATTSTTTINSINPDGSELVQEVLATSTAIRFQERATGHIYDVFEFLRAPQKISNQTETKIYNTIFTSNKNQFLMQTLNSNNEQITTISSNLVFSSTTGTSLTKSTVSNSISDFVFNPGTNKLIYSTKQNGVSNIYTSNTDRTNEKLILTLSFNEFLLDIINSNEILVTTKASYSSPGYAYILNINTGNFNKLIGNLPGLLVKMSPDKKYYIYSQSEQTRPSVRLVETQSKTTRLLTIDTLPEKCVFSKKDSSAYCFGSLIYKSAKYPDDWYKGKVFNSDSLYKIDLASGEIKALYNFEEDNLTFDVINPQITQNDTFIIFENKYDLTLWSLNIPKLSNELN